MLSLLAVIFLLLSLASIVVSYQLYRQPTPERLNNRKRIGVWWVIFIVCSLCFYLGLAAIIILLSILILWLSIELCSLFSIRLSTKYICAMAMAWLASISLVLLLPHTSLAVCVFFTLLAFGLYRNWPLFTHQWFWWWCYCASGMLGVIVLAELLNSMQLSYFQGLMPVFFIAAINDISQYIVGSVCGKIKITPRLSPNKTLEGMMGGIVVCGIASVMLLPSLWGLMWQSALLLGYCIALLGIAGDLMISLLKRRMGTKHAGNSLPGHGGILDRLDSLIMIAPIFSIVIMFTQ